MKHFLLGVLFCLVAIPLLLLVYLRSGYAPVATAAPPFPLERKLAQMALAARVSHEAPAQAAVSPTPDNLVAGAKLYRELCVFCHGARGSEPSPAARGMYPPPPQLLRGKGVTRDPVGEIYWKVANGIRLTGMPSYDHSLTETQIWQISQLLVHADQLPPDAAREVAK